MKIPTLYDLLTVISPLFYLMNSGNASPVVVNAFTGRTKSRAHATTAIQHDALSPSPPSHLIDWGAQPKKYIKKTTSGKNNHIAFQSSKSLRRARSASLAAQQNNASTTPPESQTLNPLQQTQRNASESSQTPTPTKLASQNQIPCHLQALLNILFNCDKYIEVSQVNKKLKAWKNHEAFVLALAKYEELSTDFLSSKDLNAFPGMKTALVYKAITQLTHPIQWEQALAPNPDKPSEIGYDGWTMKHAVGRPLLEVRLALTARIQTLLVQNNLGKIPGLAEEIFNWISQDPTLVGEPSASILYGSWEWMTLWCGIDFLIEEGYDPAQCSTDELLIMGDAILSVAIKGGLAEEETSPPPLSNITTTAFTQEPSHEAYTVSLGTQRPILTSAPSVSIPRTVTPAPTRAQESLNETCIPHAASQVHPQTLPAPKARGDVLSLLLMAHASDYIDLRTIDPCDEKTMNKLTAYAYLVRRFPKDPLIIKEIMAINSLALPTRTDVAKETFQALGSDPSPEMIERYMKEDNLNWYEDHEEEARHTPSPNASSTTTPLPTGFPSPPPSKTHKLRKLDKDARLKLKTQSLVEIFNKKFDQVVKTLSEQIAKITNKISIVQYCQDHHININNASITITTVKREVISLDKVDAIAEVPQEMGISMDPTKEKEEILESRGYFVTIQPQTSEHTSETKHLFFVRRDDLTEIHLSRDADIEDWCQDHDVLVFGSSYKESASGKIQANYYINNVVSGTNKDIETKIKNALFEKLSAERQNAYQPSWKEKVRDTVLGIIIPFYETLVAIWKGEPTSKIREKAAVDAVMFVPILLMELGSAAVQLETATEKVFLREATLLSERGVVEFLKRSSTRLARYHLAELRMAAGRAAETFVENALFVPSGIWRTLRAGRKVVLGGVRQLRYRLSNTHPQLAQKLSTLSKATNPRITKGTWHLSDVATTSKNPYVKAINEAGDTQLLERIGSNKFVALNPQNLVPDKRLVVLTSEGELATTFTEVLQHYGLKSDKDAVILARIARQQEKPSHIFEVGLRNYAKVEIGEKNYVYVEVEPYGPSKSATYWRLYDPKIRQPEILPSIVWNKVLGKWRPTNPHLKGGTSQVTLAYMQEHAENSEEISLLKSWEGWLAEAAGRLPRGARILTAREKAADRLMAVLYDNEDILNLYGLELGNLAIELPLCRTVIVSVDFMEPILKNPPKILTELVFGPSSTGVTGGKRNLLFSDKFKNLEKLSATNCQLDTASLTAKFPKLKTLNLSNNQLHSVDLGKLPSLRQAHLENNLLGSIGIPELKDLEELYLQNNIFIFISFPKKLTNLKHLELRNNKLVNRPQLQKMPSLKYLGLSHNQLISFPELLDELPKLKHLDLSYNKLISFPESLEKLPKLKHLDLSHNNLQDIPLKKLSKLEFLNLAHNKFTHLPDEIFRLPSKAVVRMEHNLIPDNELIRLRELVTDSNYRGPRIIFSLEDERGVGVKTSPIHEVIGKFFPKSERPNIKEKWGEIEEKDAKSGYDLFAFNRFMQRVIKTDNIRKDSGFSIWINELAESQDLRESTYAIANEGIGSCSDRVALVYNNMQKERIKGAILKGKYDNNIPDLVKLSREMFRFDEIAAISYKKAEMLINKDEELEVHLAYLVKLRKSLELSWVAADMDNFIISGITKEDIKSALEMVQKKENEEFLLRFSKSSTWLKLAERIEPVLYKKVDDRLRKACTIDALKKEIDVELAIFKTESEHEMRRIAENRILDKPRIRQQVNAELKKVKLEDLEKVRDSLEKKILKYPEVVDEVESEIKNLRLQDEQAQRYNAEEMVLKNPDVKRLVEEELGQKVDDNARHVAEKKVLEMSEVQAKVEAKLAAAKLQYDEDVYRAIGAKVSNEKKAEAYLQFIHEVFAKRGLSHLLEPKWDLS